MNKLTGTCIGGPWHGKKLASPDCAGPKRWIMAAPYGWKPPADWSQIVEETLLGYYEHQDDLWHWTPDKPLMKGITK